MSVARGGEERGNMPWEMALGSEPRTWQTIAQWLQAHPLRHRHSQDWGAECPGERLAPRTPRSCIHNRTVLQEGSLNPVAPRFVG